MIGLRKKMYAVCLLAVMFMPLSGFAYSVEAEGSIDFDGVDGCYKGNYYEDVQAKDFTWNSWYNADKGDVTIVGKDYNHPSIVLEGLKMRGRFNQSSGTADIYSVDDIATSVDVMGTFTYNSDNYKIKLYVNGELVDEDTTDGTYDPDSDFEILIGCHRGSPYNYFDGDIKSFEYYDRVLTASEIIQIYNAGSDSVTPVTRDLIYEFYNSDVSEADIMPELNNGLMTFIFTGIVTVFVTVLGLGIIISIIWTIRKFFR